MRVYLMFFVIFLILTVFSAKAAMPLPQQITTLPGEFELKADFNLFADNQMTARFADHLMPRLAKVSGLSFKTPISTDADKATLLITLTQGKLGRTPQLGDNERYSLSVNNGQIQLTAANEFGVMRGLETLLQRFYQQGKKLGNVNIEDWPRFAWRGLLIDSVRHFLPVATIKRQLDGMASAKLNVLHWHLTDDQGWRIESLAYPKLQQLAADGLYYRRREIKQVVEYAAQLGIRVVPEFDVPGHASAIAVAYPALLTSAKDYQMQRHWGVFEPLLDPSKPEVYQFIDTIVGELTTLFPDAYLHIGGDEVNPAQWQQSTAVQQYMRDNSLDNTLELHSHFNAKVNSILKKHQRKMIGWDEVLHPTLPKDIVVQSWRGLGSLGEITAAGYQGLLSSGFYIDQPQYSAFHYRNDPLRQLTFVQPQISAKTTRQDWTFTMPRLKGSAVSGRFILIKNAGQGQEKKAYLQFNGRGLQMVNDLAVNGNQISFWLDSWMGPFAPKWDISNADALRGEIRIGNMPYGVSGKQLSVSKGEDITALPQPSVSDEVGQLILGGEATLWSEMVTEHNIDLRVWPRLYAIAERLWSSKTLVDEDNMYQRLNILDRYATDVVGLKHQSQQLEGLKQLVADDAAISLISTITVLARFAQMLEPAHYYTRHHLKFQQNKDQQNNYHQQAPLNAFVDYLPVESLPLMALKRQIKAFKQGDGSALVNIKRQLLDWQNNMAATLEVSTQSADLLHLKPLANEVNKVINLGLEVVGLYLSGEVSLEDMQSMRSRLAQSRVVHGEIIIGLVYVIEDLLRVGK